MFSKLDRWSKWKANVPRHTITYNEGRGTSGYLGVGCVLT